MAALQSIRNHPVLLTGILGGGLILMIIMFGFDDYNGFFQGGRDTVLSVNGDEVKYTEYETERKRKSDFIETFYQQEVNKSEIAHEINNQTYNEFVQKALLAPEFEKAGIAVSGAELSELVQGSHISPVMTNIFQGQAQMIGAKFAELIETNGFDEFVQQTGMTWASFDNWMEIETQIINTRKGQKLATLLHTAIKPNKLEAEDAFNNDNTEVAFTYVSKNAREVADSLVKVSTSDIKAFYEPRKEQFKTNKSREIDYIAVPLYPSEEDQNNTFAALMKVKDQFAEGTDLEELINGNSTVPYIDAYLRNTTFRGDLKEFIETAEVGAVSEPQIFSGDVLNLIGERSQNHEELNRYYWMARVNGKVNAPDSIKVILQGVTAETKDSIKAVVNAAKAEDASAQWLTDVATITFESGLREKLFTVKANETFEYTFNNGQQDVTIIGKVVERTANVDKTKVAIYAERINPSSKTRREEYGKLNEFLNANPTLAQIEDSALVIGMKTANIATSMYNINEVRECRNAIRFVFEGEKGDISEIYEEGGYLLVVGIKGDIKEGILPATDKDFVQYAEAMLLPGKKVAYVMDNIFSKVSDKTIEGYAAAAETEAKTASRVSFSTSSISGLGVEPKVIAAAVKAQEGAIVGPIAGDNNVVVLQVSSKTEKGLTYDEETYKNRVAQSYRNIENLATQLLNREASIEDNRIKFY